LVVLLNNVSPGYSYPPIFIAQQHGEIAQQSIPEQQPLPQPDLTQPQLPESEQILPSESPRELPETESIKEPIPIVKIEVIGSTIFGAEELDPIIKPLEGRSVSREELENAAQQITQLYLDEGYLNSRARLGQVRDGIAQIQVSEGSLAEIEIQGTKRLENYVRSRLKLATEKPLNVIKLEDRLRLLKANPLFENIEASLQPGKQKGQTKLVVRVTEADPLLGNLGIDNYSPPSVGGVRLGLDLAYQNLTGIGDRLSASYLPAIETIGGTYELEFAYQAPLNPMDGSLRLGALIDRNKVIEGDFEDLDIQGETEKYQIRYRQPLILTTREELALSLGFVYNDGQTFLFQEGFPFGIGPDEDGVSRTSVLELGQEYILRQSSGAWAFRSQFRIGLPIFDATENSSPIPDGQFFSWLAQFQRVQVLNDNNFLIIQGDLQLTPNSLLPSEQFAIGGVYTVRGYRQNALSGDNGFRFSVEDRITVARNKAGDTVFAVAPFFDLGVIWNVDDNPNPQPPQNFITALGLGLLWQPVEGLNLRLDYAPPLIDLEGRENDLQDYGLNFSVIYSF
jgi:hemolysin activation/secretion protein